MPKKAQKKKSIKKTKKSKAVKKPKKAKKSHSKPVIAVQKHPEPKVVIVKKHIVQKPNFGKLKHDPPSHHWFVLCSGKEIKNLREFAHDLGEMEDFVFDHHVSDQRNDFVSWIKDVFDDLELAEKVSQEKDKKRMQLLVYEHILDKLW